MFFIYLIYFYFKYIHLIYFCFLYNFYNCPEHLVYSIFMVNLRFRCLFVTLYSSNLILTMRSYTMDYSRIYRSSFCYRQTSAFVCSKRALAGGNRVHKGGSKLSKAFAVGYVARVSKGLLLG